MASAVSDQSFDAEAAASAFIGARWSARSMPAYPGPMPESLADAYRCQDAAIRKWPDDIIGWKVGWIAPPASAQLGEQRLLGPIFRTRLYRSTGIAPVNVAIFVDGFAAVEAEFVFELARDAQPQGSWTCAQAAEVVARMYIGIEIASSPLATINALGATAVISDFGNHAGLLLGPEVPDWRARSSQSLACETRIEGRTVGTGSAASVAGGPLEALAFALRYSESRGRPLRAGDYVTTGATTGIHDIRVGQRAEAVFTGVGSLRCIAAPMPPLVR